MNNVNAKTDAGTSETAANFVKRNKLLYSILLIVIMFWVVFTWQGLTTAISIWYGNEIFNHGFFIVPGSVYLIYLKRNELLAQPLYSTPLAFVLVIPSLLLYIVGVAGDIQLFMHTATFTLLPALLWLILGSKAAKTILFPLSFMLFSIPVGEQLIPYLQEIAADGSVALLQLTGVPLFRSGLYIEIPQGRFLVAEACSGVSFFIASFVIGSLYAYLNLRSSKRRAVFVVISLIFPVLANIVRVYGIILIAYWTDMEHAAGADHLIYGWFFFAFVIICLLGGGELMREKPTNNLPAKQVHYQKQCYNRTSNKSIIIGACVLILLSTMWSRSLAVSGASVSYKANFYPGQSRNCLGNYIDLSPVLNLPDRKKISFIKKETICVTIYEADFSSGKSEMISSLNKAYSDKKWSLVSTTPVKNFIIDNDEEVNIYQLSSPSGNQAFYTQWYEYSESIFTSEGEAKVHEIVEMLSGKKSSKKMVILVSPNLVALEEAGKELVK